VVVQAGGHQHHPGAAALPVTADHADGVVVQQLDLGAVPELARHAGLGDGVGGGDGHGDPVADGSALLGGGAVLRGTRTDPAAPSPERLGSPSARGNEGNPLTLPEEAAAAAQRDGGCVPIDTWVRDTVASGSGMVAGCCSSNDSGRGWPMGR
jgi:hypothetical protein